VPIAAKLPWSLSSPRWVNQPTAKRAFQNTCLSGQKASAGTAVLTPNKRGRGEEVTGKKKKEDGHTRVFQWSYFVHCKETS